MTLAYSHRPIGDSWPGPRTRNPGRSPFGANWGGTLALLEREIRHLGGRQVVMAVETEPRWIRNDGGLRADARLKDPGVIIEFKVGPDLLAFPCDRFNYWQDNVRAIALALEALRKVDRYGVRQGKQYEGFKALPGAGGASVTMDAAAAARLVAELSGGWHTAPAILSDAGIAQVALRSAAGRTHPDRLSGSVEQFQQVQAARAVLAAHHHAEL